MSERKNWLTDEKHKELSDKYDHYVCDICSEIGAQLVISKFVNDLKSLLKRSIDYKIRDILKELIEKWEENL